MTGIGRVEYILALLGGLELSHEEAGQIAARAFERVRPRTRTEVDAWEDMKKDRTEKSS